MFYLALPVSLWLTVVQPEFFLSRSQISYDAVHFNSSQRTVKADHLGRGFWVPVGITVTVEA